MYSVPVARFDSSLASFDALRPPPESVVACWPTWIVEADAARERRMSRARHRLEEVERLLDGHVGTSAIDFPEQHLRSRGCSAPLQTSQVT
jgi:hypothetical protein